MVMISIIFIVLICIIMVLLTLYIVSNKRYSKLEKEYYSEKRYTHRIKNKQIMIEYHLREYKEGKNAYTVLADLQNLIRFESDKDDNIN